jgi:Ser/Thr protein kinase RdoA (MazF antagonist)
MTDVVRVGDTVRRTAGPWTPSVQALLRHVREHGVDWVPEPRGLDERGREVVGYVPGDVHGYPLPGWMWSDAILEAAARRLRAYHDATAGFARAGRVWRLPSHAPDEVVCHNDFAPYNFVFRGRQLVGVIDFDTAAPGPRTWDLAYLAYRLVPLTAPENPDAPASTGAQRRRRLERLCVAYGGADSREVVALVPARLDELAALTAARGPAFAADVRIYAEDAAQIRSNAAWSSGSSQQAASRSPRKR